MSNKMSKTVPYSLRNQLVRLKVRKGFSKGESMKLAIIGSRSFSDFEIVESEYLKLKGVTEIVSGGAKGADQLGEALAEKYNLRLSVFIPDWKTYGRAAGVVRNKSIVEASDYVLAFWDGKSKGTQSSIKFCEKMGKELLIKMV
jgi:hypothetical protein